MIIGQALLQQIRNIIPGAIIAGGYVRDHVMNGKFKDIDIFFPVQNHKDYAKLVDLVMAEKLEGLTVDPAPKEKYKGYHTFYTSDFLFHNIPVQLIGHRIPKEEFAEKLMESFNFNIDKMYYDGTDTIVTEEAQNDINTHSATLCELRELSYIPIAIKKFQRLQEKYPNIKFKCDCLEIKKPKIKTAPEEYFGYKVQDEKRPWVGVGPQFWQADFGNIENRVIGAGFDDLLQRDVEAEEFERAVRAGLDRIINEAA